MSVPLFRRLRLRHKMAVMLSLAALLPVAVASTVAVRIVLRGLDRGLTEQTSRQLGIAMNLVLRHVERLGADAAHLASLPAVAEAIGDGGPGADRAVDDLLAREGPHMPSALVQVANARGRIMATRAVGGNRERFRRLEVDASSVPVQRGLAYERRVNLAAVGDILVVRAVAPVVDPSFSLRGVVVMSLPLDGDFADGIKGALGADVLIHAGRKPANSSFLDSMGGRTLRIDPPASLADDVLAGGTRLTSATIEGLEYALGYAPLKNLEGDHIGMLAVAVGRGSLVAAKNAAARSLILGAAGAFFFALALAGLLSRGLTQPIGRLHAGALAVARGDLSVRLRPIDEGDEIGDLAAAFATMTRSLRENQQRLAARMREIVALHEAGRAVSSVLGLDEVLRKIVDSVARVLDARLAVLWLVDLPAGPEGEPLLRVGAARSTMEVEDEAPNDVQWVAQELSALAASVASTRTALRMERVEADERFRAAAEAAGVEGTLLAVPLERKRNIAGVLVVGRQTGPAFTDAEENLVGAFADQAAAAIENARLYEEVRAFSEDLEVKVNLRTRELTAINAELGRAIGELRDTQAQLVLSERMAGLGSLVAGIAHEINSPSAAIRGAADALAENVRRLAKNARELGELGLAESERGAFLEIVEDLAPRLARERVQSPAEVRRRTRELRARLSEAGVADADVCARALVEIGADRDIGRLEPLLLEHPATILVGYLHEYTYLHRNAVAIDTAIKQVQRIVGALKSYSHLDQAKVESADIHEGIENTLVILHHELKYGITITRRFGELPRIPVFVDELNQVWTNLIHNAVQAVGGKGEIVIETVAPGPGEEMVAVRVIDNGPGIPADVLPRIFEPFFTTKVKGEGTGLGLGIVRNIVDKHRGRIEVESEPGRTCFTVLLPVDGPEEEAGSSSTAISAAGDAAAAAAQGGVSS